MVINQSQGQSGADPFKISNRQSSSGYAKEKAGQVIGVLSEKATALANAVSELKKSVISESKQFKIKNFDLKLVERDIVKLQKAIPKHSKDGTVDEKTLGKLSKGVNKIAHDLAVASTDDRNFGPKTRGALNKANQQLERLNTMIGHLKLSTSEPASPIQHSQAVDIFPSNQFKDSLTHLEKVALAACVAEKNDRTSFKELNEAGSTFESIAIEAKKQFETAKHGSAALLAFQCLKNGAETFTKAVQELKAEDKVEKDDFQKIKTDLDAIAREISARFFHGQATFG